MLSDERGETVVSSLGWVETPGKLWIFRASRGAAETIPIGEARYISLHAGVGDFFSVHHHFQGDRVEVTVHHFAQPAEVIGRAIVGPGGSRLVGDPSAWSNVQKHYVAYYVDS